MIMASIEQRGDSYRVVWRHEGLKQYATWPDLASAEQARDLAEAHRHHITADRVYAIILGEEPEQKPATPTLREWCEQWLPSKTRLSPGTRHRYMQKLRDHIYPTFGDVPIGQIDAVAIGTWLNHMSQIMGSPRTVTRYYSVLHSALEAAYRQRRIPYNPSAEVDFVRDQVAYDDTGDRHQPVYLTPAQYELLRARFPAKWHTLLDCIIETGMRWGEVTALARKHLVAPTRDAGPAVNVTRAWKQAAGGKLYLGTTKGRSKRRLSIGTDLYEALCKLVADGNDETLIFRRRDGSALNYSTMHNDVWKPALIRARRCAEHPPPDQEEQRPDARGRCRDYGGVRHNGDPCGSKVSPGKTRCWKHCGPAPHAVSSCDCPTILRVSVSWHDLRHSHSAWLFSDPRMTPLAISRRLGHATLATTSEIYGDLMPYAAEIAVDAIADARKAGRGAG